MRTDLPQETAQSRALRQVDDMMQRMDEQTGMWLQGGVGVRSRWRIGHQQTDRSQSPADLVQLAVW